ncbi:MAG: 2-oxoacid:acceptor oxidoreductase family protein [Paracoccaceae bacterium]
MHEILILGRGGQGAQTAGSQLARAFFAEGLFVQTFATYGGARRGTPVTASLRADNRPIRLRSNIKRASAVLCFDDSLLDETVLRIADEKTFVVVNSDRPGAAFLGLGDWRVLPVNGKEIARRNDLGKVVNSALLGALAAAIGAPDIETMCQVIGETAPARVQENVAACREAFEQTTDNIAEATR